MSRSPYSDAFIQWAALAGNTLSLYKDIWVLADNGGELCYYLRSTDMHTITQVERGGSEVFIMSAMSILDIERYFTVLFGGDIRSGRRLRRISCTTGLDTLYSHCKTPLVKKSRLALVDPYGQTRGYFPAPIGRADDVIWFSWILDASLEDLRASYLDPDGLPLFPGLRIGPPRE